MCMDCNKKGGGHSYSPKKQQAASSQKKFNPNMFGIKGGRTSSASSNFGSPKVRVSFARKH
jgi:hypothetical protein